MPYICNAALDCEKSIDAVMGRQPQKPLRYRNCVKLSKSRLPLEFRLLDSHQFLFHRGFLTSIAAALQAILSAPQRRGTIEVRTVRQRDPCDLDGEKTACSRFWRIRKPAVARTFLRAKSGTDDNLRERLKMVPSNPAKALLGW